ncbi:DUF6037 family protein [Vreelandella profundi]|uniref:DUF6037 family protein n=1 Tax=Vreelandella profundi TaxID=2852117 RepID=UPI001EF0849E|nr:DUF6037 family protein [Halomonas profundi]
MKMTSLQELHKSMIAIRSDMQQFQVTLGAISFDCLFSTRDKPNFTLSLTSRGLNPKFFLLQVKTGYWIAPFFDEFYGELAKLLNAGRGSGNKLIPKEFLEKLNAVIPVKAIVERNPPPNEIIRLRPDVTEDRDRPYFDTWIYWSKDSGKGPSEENRYKTQMVLGDDAINYSKLRNASSRWSAVDLSREWKD